MSHDKDTATPVILGTTKPQRMIDGCAGSEIPLTRKEWYELYAAAGNMIP